MAGLWDLPAMGALFYLWAGWTQWKPQAPIFHLGEAAVNYSMTEVLKVKTSHYMDLQQFPLSLITESQL